MRKFLLFVLSILLFSVEASAEGTSGLDIPRMASIGSSRVNARSGPGARYPIEWVYLQKNEPVEIIAEFEHWRKIKDWEGSQSWVHRSMLHGSRMVKITNKGNANIYLKADFDSKPIAKVEVEVIGELKKCPQGSKFCLIKFGNIEGWVAKANFFGVYPEEVIN